MDILFTVLAYAGVVVVLFQTWPYVFTKKTASRPDTPTLFPKVFIIVPARNEEKSLPDLLNSLLLLNYPDFEIIVVDDQSSDLTYQVASAFPVKVIKAPPKPAGWIGKSWACHIGANQATGTLLLFTDADTVHMPDSLRSAVVHLQKNENVLVTAPSYHRNDNWWEKLLGPFYFLVTVAATPYNKPSFENPYAIGQYLLFDRQFYQQTGGHATIKGSLAEDVDLARLILSYHKNYSIYTDARLYAVQMYPDFKSFIDGWNRLLRLGMQYMGFSSVVISILSIFALVSFISDGAQLIRLLPTLITLCCMGTMQRKIGNFSIWGIFLFPIGVILFMCMGIYAALLQLLHMPLVWRGRIYKQSTNESTWAGKAS